MGFSEVTVEDPGHGAGRLGTKEKPMSPRKATNILLSLIIRIAKERRHIWTGVNCCKRPLNGF
jgi:hypothetical protein